MQQQAYLDVLKERYRFDEWKDRSEEHTSELQSQ